MLSPVASSAAEPAGTRCAAAAPASRRTYTVVRDRWLEGLGREEMDLFADELSEAELIRLPEADRADALREIGCVLEKDKNGRTWVVTDPALDKPEAEASGAQEAA